MSVSIKAFDDGVQQNRAARRGKLDEAPSNGMIVGLSNISNR